MEAEGEELKAGALASENPVKRAEIRVTNHLSLLGTISVIVLKVPCPGKLLHPEKMGTVCHPSRDTLAQAPRRMQVLSRGAGQTLPRWNRQTKRENDATSKIF